jgi:hypothetical protein
VDLHCRKNLKSDGGGGGTKIYHFKIQGEHKFFPDYKHLLQENYVEYKYIMLYNATYNNTKLL